MFRNLLVIDIDIRLNQRDLTNFVEQKLYFISIFIAFEHDLLVREIMLHLFVF